MAYVYRHIRLDKNEPFYIGIGSDEQYKRAHFRWDRNKYWTNIVSKTDYEVEILIDDVDWGTACKKEMEFISLYGRFDLGTGCLVNMTNGGDGAFGLKHSEESRKRMSEKRKGIRQYVATEETKKKLSDIAKKRGIPSEQLKKMMESKRLAGWTSHRKGVKHTEEARLKISNAKKGTKKSEEWKKAASERVKLYWKNKKSNI